MGNYRARHKRIVTLLDQAQKIREKANGNGTPEELLNALELTIDLNKRVTDLVSQSIEQNTRFIEDSKSFLSRNLERFSLTLPASINEPKIWTCVADDHRLIREKTV